jgi:hypothetical protein
MISNLKDAARLKCHNAVIDVLSDDYAVVDRYDGWVDSNLRVRNYRKLPVRDGYHDAVEQQDC